MYNFTVAAHNMAGVGPTSAPIPIVIPATVGKMGRHFKSPLSVNI